MAESKNSLLILCFKKDGKIIEKSSHQNKASDTVSKLSVVRSSYGRRGIGRQLGDPLTPGSPRRCWEHLPCAAEGRKVSKKVFEKGLLVVVALRLQQTTGLVRPIAIRRASR